MSIQTKTSIFKKILNFGFKAAFRDHQQRMHRLRHILGSTFNQPPDQASQNNIRENLRPWPHDLADAI